jgi:PIN domain nuclease of toxin-antitoxin system
MIAYLRNEPGGEAVKNLLRDSSNQCYAHAVNLCEVFYDFCRASGESVAEASIRDLLRDGLILRADMDQEFWQAAGKIKAAPGRVSLADCFAITLARRLDGEVVTADHHEFDALVPLGYVRSDSSDNENNSPFIDTRGNAVNRWICARRLNRATRE